MPLPSLSAPYTFNFYSSASHPGAPLALTSPENENRNQRIAIRCQSFPGPSSKECLDFQKSLTVEQEAGQSFTLSTTSLMRIFPVSFRGQLGSWEPQARLLGSDLLDQPPTTGKWKEFCICPFLKYFLPAPARVHADSCKCVFVRDPGHPLTSLWLVLALVQLEIQIFSFQRHLPLS